MGIGQQVSDDEVQCFSAPVSPRKMHARVPLSPSPSPATPEDKCTCSTNAIMAPSGLLPPTLPSIGSRNHGSGRCKPCGWFWKPAGCANGAECGHCHLCPEGEIRLRRKAKLFVIRAQNENISTVQDNNDIDLSDGQPRS